MTARSQLVLIGLDAASRDFISAHRADLPNISRIFDEGVGGHLDSVPLAGAAWPTFYTRTEPAEHGMFGQLQWDPAEMRVRRADGDWLPNRPFWRDLGARGVRVIAMDIPFVFPGDAPNVLEIVGWGQHEVLGPFHASDKAMARRIIRLFGHPTMKFDVTIAKTKAQLTRLRDDLVDGAARKARLVAWLMREMPWDVFLVSFGEMHRGGHWFWPNPDGERPTPIPPEALKQVYMAVDSAVGAVTRAGGPNADVIVCAMHGMAPDSSQSHLTSLFMRRAVARFQGKPAPSQLGDAPGVMRALRRSVPTGLQLAIAEAVPAWVRDAVVAREIVGGLRWRETLGFGMHPDVAGYVRFNVQGRESEGACSNDNAAALTDFVHAELKSLSTGDGRPVVREIHFPTRDWTGARAHLLPDIVIEWNPELGPALEVSSPTLGVIRARPKTTRTGNHPFEAFYTHRGPRQGQGPRPRHIKDLGALVEALA